MQAKDIPELPILTLISQNPESMFGWHNLTPRRDYCPTVRDAMPEGVPEKLVLAKMKQLMKRGLVSGCPCGCRGDFEITDKGRQFVAKGGEK